MEKNGLLLSADEKVAKRYDFVDGSEENALIITNDRVIRRVIGGDTFLQNELRTSDVGRIATECQTKHHYSEPYTDPKKYIFILIAVLLLAAAGYCIYRIVMGAGRVMMIAAGAAVLLAIIFLIVAFKLKKKRRHTEETVLLINIYDRYCNECVIAIEKVTDSRDTARDIANEIGSLIFGISSAAVSLPQDDAAVSAASFEEDRETPFYQEEAPVETPADSYDEPAFDQGEMPLSSSEAEASESSYEEVATATADDAETGAFGETAGEGDKPSGEDEE